MTNIDIIQALDNIRINNLYVHNSELEGAKFSNEKLKDRKVYLVETLAVINALVERGTMMLYGGHGGGKTTLSKYLGQLFCHLTKEKIEDCILRGHPQLTEEKILGSLDFAQMTGNKPLDNGKLSVVWNEFVTSRWKIIDEINRLSPYAQNILLSLLAEGSVKYHDQSMIVPAFALFATLNPKDNANTELSLPFKDRFALALPITMPDYDSFSTIGKRDKSSYNDRIEEYLQDVNLEELQEIVKNIPYTEEAELFINYIIASYRLCERAFKESNDNLSVDKILCENCHMCAPEKVCSKIKLPLSVRVKEDLYRYGKALAWFLGNREVNVNHIEVLAPYMIWHRAVLSKKYVSTLTEHWKNTNSGKQTSIFITNIDLDGTRNIIQMIKNEFDGIKDLLMGFERVKTGTLSVPEFNEYLKEIRDSSYNSLVISAEIVPVLNEKYAPVYDKIVSYNNQIDNSKGDISKLKAIKSELAFRYDIPNRQYISERVNRSIKKIEIKEYTFKLEKDSIISNPQLSSLIQAVIPGTDLANGDIQKVKPFKLLDITRDACDLSVKRLKKYIFTYQGDEDSELFKYLQANNVN